MRKAKCLWLSFIQAWGDLFNFAPRHVAYDFEINTEHNNLSSHFNAAWDYLSNAIDSEKN